MERRGKWCDVSVYQGVVNFIQLASEGFVGTIIRAGNGFVPDSKWDANRMLAKVAGLYVGYYWYFRPNLDWQKQADAFLKTLDGDFGHIPLVIDLETDGGILPISRVLPWVKSWCEYIALSTGKKPFIYTSPYWWRKLGGTDPKNAWASEYYLWMAQWPFDADPNIASKLELITESALTGKINPYTVYPWISPDMWQFTSRGVSTAVQSAHLDLDVTVKPWAEAMADWGLTELPPPPTTPVTFEELAQRFTALEAWAKTQGYADPK